MATITKKHLVDALSDATGLDRPVVKHIVHLFFAHIVAELEQGNRIEFRDFGVFEVKTRAARRGQNPKTLERVEIASRRVVRFKEGRLMREALNGDAKASTAALLRAKGSRSRKGADRSAAARAAELAHIEGNGQVVHVPPRRRKAIAQV